MLLLAASIVAPPAEAQTAPERYVFYLVATATGSLDDLCVGDRVVIDVKAERLIANKRATDTQEVTNPPVQVFGVTINATAGNAAIGSLSPASQMTSAGGTPPGTARFVFTAKKPGSTGILFKGTKIATGWFLQFVHGNRDYLSTELEATVRQCQYDVAAVSNWNGNGFDFKAILDEGRLSLTATADRTRYVGKGTVTWIVTESPPRPGCAPHALEYTSEVDLSAESDGSENLVVDMAYEPLVGDWFWYRDCTTRNSRELLGNTPEALTFTVPASGGQATFPHRLVDTYFEALNLSGSTWVTVTPVTQQQP